MNILAVAEELAQTLKTISNLQVFAFQPGTITPPTAVIGFPERLDFDATMGRGLDRAEWEIFVFVPYTDLKAAFSSLSAFTSGSGNRSIKQRLEDHQPVTYSAARVKSVETDGYTYAGATYLGARFLVDVIGTGED